MIGAGVQPVPGPTLPESSSAERKAWLRNGSPAASGSHDRAYRRETPDAILARTSVSRSAIAFPDDGIGLNRALRPLFGRVDRPAVNRQSVAELCDPWLSERGTVHGNELRIGNPKRH